MSAQGQKSAINSEQRTIGNLLGDKRFLRVPAYQRSFSWTKSEVTDLWGDLQGILRGSEDCPARRLIPSPRGFLSLVVLFLPLVSPR
jgi:uncharacterized protein with ParB-like and HNH nuclease domain